MTPRHHGQFDSDPLEQQTPTPAIPFCSGVLSMLFGLIAWAVVVPTLLMVAVGIFIDEHSISNFSWAVFMALIGGVVGSVNVLLWLRCRSKQ